MHTGPQSPHDCAIGFLYLYSNEEWEAWLKQFGLQANMEYKVCTGRNANKEVDIYRDSVTRRKGSGVQYAQNKMDMVVLRYSLKHPPS